MKPLAQWKDRTLKRVAFTLFAVCFIMVCALVGSWPWAAKAQITVTPAPNSYLGGPNGIQSRMMTTVLKGTPLNCMVFRVREYGEIRTVSVSCDWKQWHRERGEG